MRKTLDAKASLRLCRAQTLDKSKRVRSGSQPRIPARPFIRFTNSQTSWKPVARSNSWCHFCLSGSVDAIFLPDRATAPSIAVLFEAAQIEKTDVTIIGSADWDGDVKISQTPFLTGAFFPAVDSAGYERLKPEYEATYSATPHPMATFAYTAVLLANSSSLANATPRYDRNQLTRPSGFAGQDGVFRFLDNGTNQHALVMKQVVIDGSRVVDSAKMP